MNQADLFRLHPERQHRKPPKKLKLSAEPKEAAVLASVLQALNFYPSVSWFRRMNSGAYVLGEHKQRRFIRFGFEGCSDIIGQMKPRRKGLPGAWLAIEVKSATGKVSDHQERFLDMVNAAGGVGFVARSVDDLKQHLGNVK